MLINNKTYNVTEHTPQQQQHEQLRFSFTVCYMHELTCMYVSERVNEHKDKLSDALKTGRTHVQNAVVCIVVERVSVGIVG